MEQQEEPATLLDLHVPMSGVESEIRERDDGSWFWRVKVGRYIASRVAFNEDDARTNHAEALRWARTSQLRDVLRKQM